MALLGPQVIHYGTLALHNLMTFPRDEKQRAMTETLSYKTERRFKLAVSGKCLTYRIWKEGKPYGLCSPECRAY